jgi:hypothetical protein
MPTAFCGINKHTQKRQGATAKCIIIIQTVHQIVFNASSECFTFFLLFFSLLSLTFVLVMRKLFRKIQNNFPSLNFKYLFYDCVFVVLQRSEYIQIAAAACLLHQAIIKYDVFSSEHDSNIFIK